MLGAARAIKIKVAESYRALRKHGVTVRKTTDAIIATFCIEERMPLRYWDRDFDPFEAHLGLQRVKA
jgi:predicted nucleic acid-binding protein